MGLCPGAPVPYGTLPKATLETWEQTKTRYQDFSDWSTQIPLDFMHSTFLDFGLGLLLVIIVMIKHWGLFV